jgi:methyl-accepting chemotaxis protein
MRLGIGFAAIALVVGAGLSWAITRGIVTPVRAMTTAMSRLAGGDLSVDVPATGRKDELGDMGRAVQVFKDNAIAVEGLRRQQAQAEAQAAAERRRTLDTLVTDFEAHVSAAVGQVGSAAGEMMGTSHTMSTVAERTSAQATAAAAAAEEASSNVQTVASAAEELAASIAEIGRQVGHATTTANNAAERAHETDTIVRTMADAANRIGEVVGMITDIANQTNMLALNATIEAARAGDAGKGFAVVAGEVKGLATQTAKATSEIAEQICAIQAVTRDAVTAIQDIGNTIAEISHVSTAIAAAVEEQQAATREIARNVEQAAAGTAEVARNVAGVTEAAAEAGRAAALVLKESEALTTTSGDLQHEAEGFIARVRQG